MMPAMGGAAEMELDFVRPDGITRAEDNITKTYGKYCEEVSGERSGEILRR